MEVTSQMIGIEGFARLLKTNYVSFSQFFSSLIMLF